MSKRKRRGGRKANQELSAARFRIHPKASEVAERLDGGTLIACLKSTFEHASRISFELRDCKYFHLLNEVDLDVLAQADESEQIDWFWTQLNELLVLISRTTSRAVLSTIDGVSWALGSKNELILALSARALLEHAAALHDIAIYITPVQNRLTSEIWPNHRSGSPLCRLTEQDKKVRKELIRFAVGRRVEFSGEPIPPFEASRKRWKKFRESLDLVPEEFKSNQIMSSIDSLSKLPEQQHLRVVYEFLCEYCHPNSASRTLDFNMTMSQFGKHRLADYSQDSLTVGFRNVYAFCRSIIPSSCLAIDTCLAVLTVCRKPMPATLLSAKPPINGRRIVDEFGRVGWAHFGKIFWPEPKFKAQLSESDRERIARIHEVFRGLELDETGQPMTFEKSVDLFSQGGPFIQEEINIWENFVDVFQREMQDRRDSSHSLRVLLFHAIQICFEAPTLGDALSVDPYLKKLPDLDRVYSRVHEPDLNRVGSNN